jgi:DNA-binding NarL/FixJ family response regulator
MSAVDSVAVIEAIYRLDAPQEDWLRGIAKHAAAALAEAHFSAYAVTYDASDVRDMRFSPTATVNAESPAMARLLETEIPALCRRSPDMVTAVFRKTGFGLHTDLPWGQALIKDLQPLMRAVGVSEILGINGVSVDGRSAHVGVLLPRRMAPVDPDLLARLSSHLAAGFRLRQRLQGQSPIEQAEAVLEPSGAVAHASGPAKANDVRAALSDAAVKLDRIRSAVGRRDPERAVRLWKALIDARWSLVDHFERDGKRYLLAQRNDWDSGPLELLTERERQVVGLAALGHPNKMIGYTLGITVSTVGVLLSRASRKLGVSSRRALIEAYEKQSNNGRGH